jgi:hypothetical protein
MNTSLPDSYPVIPPLGQFRNLLEDQGAMILREKEPAYVKRYETCLTSGLSPSQALSECNPLLSGKFSRFVDLLESLHEVNYYWKRLTETARLLEVNVPETRFNQMNEASWFVYNLDSYWHAVYGLEDRIVTFLTRFKRVYESPSTEETELLEMWTKAIELIKTKGTKKVRDPLAHMRSQGVIGWRNDHQWEAALVRNDKADLIEIYDNNFLQHKEFYLSYIRVWVPQYFETLSIMFDRLCTFSLNKLELG